MTLVGNFISTICSLAGRKGSKGLKEKIKECLVCMKTAQRHFKKQFSETFHVCCITLANAIFRMQKISSKKITMFWRLFDDIRNSVVLLMTHATLAPRFSNQNHRYSNQRSGPSPLNNRSFCQKYGGHNRSHYEQKPPSNKTLCYQNDKTQHQNNFF